MILVCSTCQTLQSACENILKIVYVVKKNWAFCVLLCCFVVYATLNTLVSHWYSFLKHLNPPSTILKCGQRQHKWEEALFIHFFQHVQHMLGFKLSNFTVCFSNCKPIKAEFLPCSYKLQLLFSLIIFVKSVQTSKPTRKHETLFWLCHGFLFCPFPNQLCISVASQIWD